MALEFEIDGKKCTKEEFLKEAVERINKQANKEKNIRNEKTKTVKIKSDECK